LHSSGLATGRLVVITRGYRGQTAGPANTTRRHRRLGPRGRLAAPPAPPERTLTQRQANAQAAIQQPPALTGLGERATRLARSDPAKMTEAEFAALPAAEKARLRGDIVT